MMMDESVFLKMLMLQFYVYNIGFLILMHTESLKGLLLLNCLRYFQKIKNLYEDYL